MSGSDADGRTDVRDLVRLGETDPAALEAHLADIEAYLDADAPEQRRQAVVAVAALAAERPRSVVDLLDRLTDLLADESLQDQAAAAIAHVAAADAGAVIDHRAALVAALDGDGVVQEPAAAALAALADAEPGELAQPGVIERLTVVLSSDRTVVRQHAAAALASIAEVDPEAVCERTAALRTRLGDESPRVRRQAALALGTAGSACPADVLPAVSDLAGLLEDADPTVRAAAAFALGHSFSGSGEVQRTVDALLGALADEAPPVRQQATFSLAVLAEEDPDAVRPGVDALARRVVDESGVVRRNARSSLATLEADYPAVVSETIEDVVGRLAGLDSDAGEIPFGEAELRGLATDDAAPSNHRAAADHALALVESGSVEAAGSKPAGPPDAGPAPASVSGEESAGAAPDQDETAVDDSSGAGDTEPGGPAERPQFCPNCGEPLDDTGEFCAACGATVE